MDAIEQIRSRPSLYFGERPPNAQDIINQLSLTAETLGATKIYNGQVGSWHTICADIDWLYLAQYPQNRDDSIWHTPWPFPELGQNTCRFEVMVYAFASRAFTWSCGGTECIIGASPSETELTEMDFKFGKWKRGISFEFSTS